MREFKHETIIIEKDAWQFLKNKSVTERGFKPLSQEQLDRIWSRDDFKNEAGKKYPITDNEIRISPNTFAIRWDRVKSSLEENGFKYRQDGYEIEGISL